MISINEDEMIDYVSMTTGIDKEIIIKVFDAEMDFLQLKGVAYKCS